MNTDQDPTAIAEPIESAEYRGDASEPDTVPEPVKRSPGRPRLYDAAMSTHTVSLSKKQAQAVAEYQEARGLASRSAAIRAMVVEVMGRV